MNVFEPTVQMICIEDIAHALSQQPRFGGHLQSFYSVAQHCLNCSYLATTFEEKFIALMHDASEAYLLDVPRPIKNNLANYKEIEHELMLLIAYKFSFEYPLTENIKKIDEDMLQTEWDCMMLRNEPFNLNVHDQYKTEKMFLQMFAFYNTKRKDTLTPADPK